ncbi:MAG: alpha/beta hydrolase [Candidatus Bathyarchaeia archaeon]|jgi:pimeloyl-ACP methyl ester carboxylesterase
MDEKERFFSVELKSKTELKNVTITNAKIIRLEDGRHLSYAEFGEPAGKPIFHFHGYPGSRLEGKIINATAARCGVRLISVDRPGMGLSDFKPKRTILDWPDDVIELADFLKINQFAVEGISGGGPYSVACAYKISDRLTSAGILSGVGPYWDPGESWSKPNDMKSVKDFWLQFSTRLPEPDRKIILDPTTLNLLTEEMWEAFRKGVRGPAYERELYEKYWGFKLEDISPNVNVYLWHGEMDVNVPISMGRSMAETIPNCKAQFYAEEGHYSTALNHLESIFGTLSS